VNKDNVSRVLVKEEGIPTMSVTITVEEAQARLKELIHQMAPGEEVVITENQQPVAKLVSQPAKPPRPGPGLGKGSIIYMAPDFDAPLPFGLLLRLPDGTKNLKVDAAFCVDDPGMGRVYVIIEAKHGQHLASADGAGQPVFGSCKEMMTIVSEDDEHLKDFEEYMK
jgi:antitoxin (DNA-binding transcriptional repressor) of toxin-antitoxin stability system